LDFGLVACFKQLLLLLLLLFIVWMCSYSDLFILVAKFHHLIAKKNLQKKNILS